LGLRTRGTVAGQAERRIERERERAPHVRERALAVIVTATVRHNYSYGTLHLFGVRIISSHCWWQALFGLLRLLSFPLLMCPIFDATQLLEPGLPFHLLHPTTPCERLASRRIIFDDAGFADIVPFLPMRDDFHLKPS